MFLPLVASLIISVAPPTGKGKPVTFSLRGVTAEQVLMLIGPIAHLNVVVLEHSRRTAFDLEVKDKPWDVLFDEVVKRAGLSSKRVGNVVLVDTEKSLAAMKPLPGRGKKLNLVTADASFDEVAPLLVERGLEPGGGGEQKLTVRWSNVPVDSIAQLATQLSAAGDVQRVRLMPMTPHVPPCTAGKTPQSAFTVQAVMSGDANPSAVLRDGAGNFWLVHRGECIGEGKVTSIRRDELVTDGAQLFRMGAAPVPVPPPEPMSDEDQKLYDEMLKELEAREGKVPAQ